MRLAVLFACLVVLSNINCQRDPEFDPIEGFNPIHTSMCFVGARSLVEEVILLAKTNQLVPNIPSLILKFNKTVDLCKNSKKYPTGWGTIPKQCMDRLIPLANAIIRVKLSLNASQPAAVILAIGQVRDTAYEVLRTQTELKAACL